NRYRALWDIHSFPTRRSSDLVGGGDADVDEGGAEQGHPRMGDVVDAPVADEDAERLEWRLLQPTPHFLVRHGRFSRSRRGPVHVDRKSTRLNSSHRTISYAVF